MRTARIALGGVAHKPWRARDAEQALVGQAARRGGVAARRPAAARARGRCRDNAFKVELAQRAVVRALQTQAVGMNDDGSQLIGAPLDRTDGAQKVTGAARYAAEFRLADCATP